MRRAQSLMLMAALIAAAAGARAQDGAPGTPRGELFGGYSYFRAGDAGTGLNGGDFSIAENVNRWFGGALDLSSHHGSFAGSGVNVTTIAYGPVFSYRRDPRFTPFFHVLLGAVRGSSGYLGISLPDTEFAITGGGGVDVKLGKHLAVRVIQADYISSHFLSKTQNNFRLSAGLVFRFGFRR